MPVIGRIHQHNVEIFLVQHLPVVPVQPRLFPRFLANRHQVRGVTQHPAIDIAKRDNLDGRDLNQPEQIRFAVPSTADQAHTPRLFCVKLHRRAGHRGRREAKGAALKKLATVHADLFSLPVT